jgi:hypothetical protein
MLSGLFFDRDFSISGPIVLRRRKSPDFKPKKPGSLNSN